MNWEKITPKVDIRLCAIASEMLPTDFPAPQYANIFVIITLICKLNCI